MNDRWKIVIKNIESDDGATLVAEPIVETYCKYVTDAVMLLETKILNKEERDIFEGSSDLALERIRDCCIEILKNRETKNG